jgi:lipopolysaccharide biosynthesis glycosyltransferase
MSHNAHERHICIAFDKLYSTYAYVLLTSILQHNADATLVVHAIAGGVTYEEKARMITYVQQHGGHMHFYELDETTTRNFVVPTEPGAYVTVAMYYRLFFPHLVPNSIEKLLYVDIDTLVIDNLRELYATDLGQCAFGAVEEAEMPLRTDLGLTSLKDYFNSGVMLMNLREWRSQRITERTIDIILTQPERISEYPDQDAMNLLVQGHWFRLAPRYNLMKAYIPHDLAKRDYPSFLAAQSIIHYNGRFKPWHRACENRFRYLYSYYLLQSPQAKAPRYAPRKLKGVEVRRLLLSRALEFYFNYPGIGQLWRSIKRRLSNQN